VYNVSDDKLGLPCKKTAGLCEGLAEITVKPKVIHSLVICLHVGPHPPNSRRNSHRPCGLDSWCHHFICYARSGVIKVRK